MFCGFEVVVPNELEPGAPVDARCFTGGTAVLIVFAALFGAESF
jgi:hypothetical protein